MESNEQKLPEELSLHELLQRISNGTFDPKNLSSEIRQMLVQVLLLRGQEHISIARILKVSDRTIRRDIKAIWDRNALTRDHEFTKRFIGEVRVRAMSFVETLTRMGHATDESVNVRSQAMFLAWRALKELLEKLDKLGYLPLEDRPVSKYKESASEPVSFEKVKLNKQEIKELKKVNAMLPQDREKVRKVLEGNLLRLSGLESFPKDGDEPTASEQPLKKEDEDPGAAGTVESI